MCPITHRGAMQHNAHSNALALMNCYRHQLALLSDTKREVPEIPEITKNPKIIRTMIAYALLSPISIASFFYCSIVSIVSHLCYSPFRIVLAVYCLVSHNRKYQSTYTIVYLLLFCLFIVLAYYTALNRHSISSSTFCTGLSK